MATNLNKIGLQVAACVHEYFKMLDIWNSHSGKSATEDNILRLMYISKHAANMSDEFFYLKKLKYYANVYKDIRTKFPATSGLVDVSGSTSFAVQYLEAFEAWQKEMYTVEKDRAVLIRCCDTAEALKALAPVEISEVILPDEPLKGWKSNLAFPKPYKFPMKIIVDADETKAACKFQKL